MYASASIYLILGNEIPLLSEKKMPIYEYQCESCKDVIEKWQSLSDKPLTTCPSCAGAMKKLISRSSFQLKGGGWYADGYNSTSKAAAKPGSGSSCADSKESSASCPKDSSASCPAKTDSPCQCG
jgi:putative FmdB family regulatory protein